MEEKSDATDITAIRVFAKIMTVSGVIIQMLTVPFDNNYNY